MKLYLMSLGAGLLVGIIYALIDVRSPAPPIIALVGLFGSRPPHYNDGYSVANRPYSITRGWSPLYYWIKPGGRRVFHVRIVR